MQHTSKNNASGQDKASVHNNAFVHETAVVDEGAILADGVKVWHFCHVMEGAAIGAGSSLGQNTFVARGVQIGRNCKVQNNVSLYEGVTLNDDVFLGPSCVFTNVINPRSEVVRRDAYAPTLLGRGVTVGANATIICGTELGEYSFVGAGAVVTKNVKPFAIMVGNPARQTGWMSPSGAKLEFQDGIAVCPDTKTKFRLRSDINSVEIIR